MAEEMNRMFGDAVTRIGERLAAFLPGLLVALLILVAALVLAWILRVLLLRVLRRVDLDRWAGELGLTRTVEWPLLVARMVQWTVIVVGLLVALTALDAALATGLALAVLTYLPDLLAAVLILLAGVLVARFLARSVLITAVNMRLQSAQLFSLAVKWLVLVLAGAMALEHLGIGRQIVILAFGILFAGIVLALALAVGLGARDLVSRSLEEHLREREKQREDVRHL